MTRGMLQRMEVPHKSRAATRQQTRGQGGSNTCSPTTFLPKYNVRDQRRDHSPFPSGVTASGAKEMHPIACQRTATNFLTTFANSDASFILVIDRRFTV